jgi:hypothetical protein
LVHAHPGRLVVEGCAARLRESVHGLFDSDFVDSAAVPFQNCFGVGVVGEFLIGERFIVGAAGPEALLRGSGPQPEQFP